jgi:hypothetical protein
MSTHPHQTMTNHHVPGIWTHLALQLLLWEMSESMGNHDSEVVDASSVD